MKVIEHIDSLNNFNGYGIIPRERLFRLLNEKNDKNLVLIQSPAGYGKTTLVMDYLKSRELSAGWITATKEMNHLYTFVYNLVHAIKLVDPGFGNNTLQMLESRREKFQLGKNSRALAIEICHTFINDFKNQFNYDVYAVIDNFHNIDETEWLKVFFEKLFENIPGSLHLFIITRQVPDLNFIRLVIEDKILKIETEDLIFKYDEIASLLNNVYAIDHTAVNAGMLENNIGGWITGIHMLLQTYGKDFDKINIHSQKIPENIFNYLADEIYKSLDDESRSFLLSTTVFDNFSDDICQYLTGINNANAIFQKLREKNLILKHHAASGLSCAENTQYNYNILFKNYLESKIYETFSKEKISELNSIALKYYENHNDVISIIKHLFLMHNYEAGITKMVDNFEQLFNEGKFEFLWGWFTEIDRSVIEKNPYLIFYYAILYKYFIGDLNTSLEYIQKAILKLKELQDFGFLIRCYINKASLLLNLGRTHEVIDELTGLLHEELSAENHSKLLFYLGLAYYQCSKYDISINFLNKSLEIRLRNNINEFERNIYILLGHIHLIKGDYKKSIAYYENTSEENPNILDKFETLCNLTLLNSQSANFQKSRKHLEQLDYIINNFPSAIFKIPYLLAKQAYLFEAGKYNENAKVLTEIAKTASSMNHKNYLYLSYRLLSDTYFHMDDLERAQIFYEYAYSCLSTQAENELEKIELAVVKSLIKKKIEPDDTIESILMLAYDYYEKQELYYSKTQTCFHLADYYFDEGNYKQSMKFFKECLNESKERNYISHLLREMAHSERLFQFALSNKIEEEFINKLIILKSEVFSK